MAIFAYPNMCFFGEVENRCSHTLFAQKLHNVVYTFSAYLNACGFQRYD